MSEANAMSSFIKLGSCLHKHGKWHINTQTGMMSRRCKKCKALEKKPAEVTTA